MTSDEKKYYGSDTRLDESVEHRDYTQHPYENAGGSQGQGGDREPIPTQDSRVPSTSDDTE